MNGLKAPIIRGESTVSVKKAIEVAPGISNPTYPLRVPNPRYSRFDNMSSRGLSIREYRFPQLLHLAIGNAIKPNSAEEETEFEQYLRNLSRPLGARVQIESIRAELIDGYSGQSLHSQDWGPIQTREEAQEALGLDGKLNDRLVFSIGGTALFPDINQAAAITVERLALHKPTFSQRVEPFFL